MRTKQTKVRLAEIAREIKVCYQWLYYRVRTGQTPVREKFGYTLSDMETLRAWAVEEGAVAESPPVVK